MSLIVQFAGMTKQEILLHGGRMMGINVFRVGLFGLNGLRLGRAGRVYRIPKLFGRLEEGYALGWNLNLRSGLGVAAGAGVALPGAEASEAANLNLVARFECSNHGFEESIDDDLSIAAGKVAQGGDFVYEVSFGHKVDSFRAREGDKIVVERFRCC
jgi:hypothetical protein